MTCSLCANPVHKRGWCRTHYRRWERHGDPRVVARRRVVPRVLSLGPVDRWARREGLSDAQLGMVLGHDGTEFARRQWVSRLRRRGLTVWEADEVATHVGVHPLEWWPDFHDVPVELDRAGVLFWWLRREVAA